MGFVSSMLGSDNDYKGHAVTVSGDENNYSEALKKAQGLGQQYQDAQMGTSAQNQQLIQALQQQAAGQGPTVAQNQLNQSTAQNINRSAAMAASSKGVDPALAAKMGIDSAANANQTAAGQAATLRAQEQLGAMGQLGNAINSQSNVNLGMAGLAGQLANTYGGLNNQSQLGQQQIQAGAEKQNASFGQNLLGGALGGAGVSGTNIKGGSWQGGEIGYAGGGQVAMPSLGEYDAYNLNHQQPVQVNPHPAQFAQVAQAPSYSDSSESGGSARQGGSAIGQLAKDQLSKLFQSTAPQAPGQPAPGSNPSDYQNLSQTPGSNPGDYMNLEDATQATGEATTDAATGAEGADAGAAAAGSDAAAVGADAAAAAEAAEATEAMTTLAAALARGGAVGSGKRKMIPGDHPQNDIVPAMLSPGEIVIPRSIAQSPEAAKKAAAFVAAIKRSKGKK